MGVGGGGKDGRLDPVKSGRIINMLIVTIDQKKQNTLKCQYWVSTEWLTTVHACCLVWILGVD